MSLLIKLLIPFIFFNILSFSSLIVFSSGIVYSDEVGTSGYYNGSIEFYLYYLFISSIIFMLAWAAVPKKIKKIDFELKYEKEIVIMSILFLVYYSIPIFLNGPAFMIGINRYVYKELPFAVVCNIKLFLAVFSFIWGAYASKDKRSFSKFIKLYITFIFIAICYGEKGSGTVLSFIFFITGYLIYSTRIRYFKFILIGLLASLIVLLVYAMQLYISGVDIEQIGEAFIIRFGRQSQVFWAVFNDRINISSVDTSIWLNGFNYYNDSLMGGKLIMYNIMPTDQYNAHNGSLAGVFPAILMYISNDIFILFLIVVIMSIIYITPFIFYFLVLMRYKKYYILLPFIVFALTVHLKIFQSGNIFLITNPKYILFYLVVIFGMSYYIFKRKAHSDLSKIDQ